MDYTVKLLKTLFDIVDLLKDIKHQNNKIIFRLESIDKINAEANGYEVSEDWYEDEHGDTE